MKKSCAVLFFLLALKFCSANHITGGQIFYTLVSQSGNNYTYSVSLLLYRDSLSSGAALDASAPIAIFDKGTNAMVWSSSVPRAFIENLHLWSPDPCINNPPTVIYQVGHYNFTVTLPSSLNGYVISYQRCCRIAGINNLVGSNSVGATYVAEIPGISPLTTAPANSSAHFIGPDTVIVCQNTFFTYSFNAIDPDGDQLTYSFCDAYTGGSTGTPAPNPPAPPPYIPVPYATPFTSNSPMGPAVTIDPNTGVVSGTAPDAGIYVVTVCVYEHRNGTIIATQRKDLQIKVGDCSLASANLPPTTINCESFTTSFINGGDQSAIHSYFWTFGDPPSGVNDSSTLQNPTHTFSDTGTFLVRLITNRGETCSDTGYTVARVYPGFVPDFTFPANGTCINHPTQFTDNTQSTYGTVNSWSWNFGDLTTLGDTSHVRNPQYTYPTPGIYSVTLIVTCTKGCIDTVTKSVTIFDKPPLDLSTRDTIKCAPDAVQLQAIGVGQFTWTPTTNINNPNVANPIVNPTSTTVYYVQLNDNGCINNDSVRVRVVSSVSLNAGADTTVCSGDAAQLHAVSDGLQFNWSPAASLSDPTITNPVATPATTTTYQVTASIGSCQTIDNVTVKAVPYPRANAGPDTTICFNTIGQLHASMIASSFSWSPTATLSNPNSLNPVATPPHTTTYIFTVHDTLGCPKPVSDTILLTVRPKVNAFAGRDTMVVIGEPLQLEATGGTNYLWSPPTALSSITIFNPIGLYDGSFDSIRYKVRVTDAVGCIDSAFVTVRVFKTKPEIFIPTGFTPNGDGLNDIFRPIAVGMKKIEYFKVYNRWGQLVFSTTTNEAGWDGKIDGRPQSTNSFVWIVKAIDYTGKSYFRKGIVTLIR